MYWTTWLASGRTCCLNGSTYIPHVKGTWPKVEVWLNWEYIVTQNCQVCLACGRACGLTGNQMYMASGNSILKVYKTTWNKNYTCSLSCSIYALAVVINKVTESISVRYFLSAVNAGVWQEYTNWPMQVLRSYLCTLDVCYTVQCFK